jgi:hypothetical protein
MSTGPMIVYKCTRCGAELPTRVDLGAPGWMLPCWVPTGKVRVMWQHRQCGGEFMPPKPSTGTGEP